MHSGKQLHFTLEYSSFKQAFQSQCSSLPADAAVATGEKMKNEIFSFITGPHEALAIPSSNLVKSNVVSM